MLRTMPPSSDESPVVTQRKRWLDDAVDIARFAGARADSYFHKRASLKVEEKGPRDYVTIADRKTEELIVEEVRRRYPDHAIIGEESTAGGAAPQVEKGQPVWVIDPIDGTANFIRGVPLWAVSVGIVVDGEPEVGVLVCPRQDEVFMAAKGLGAHLYTTPIKAAPTTSMGSAQIAIGAPRRNKPIDMLALGEKLTDRNVDVRRLGSACVAMAWTACGRIDGYVENRLSAWDIAAGLCILREAGARTGDVTSSPWMTEKVKFWCAAPGIADELAGLVGG